MKNSLLQALLFIAVIASALAQPANSIPADNAPEPLYPDSGPVISLEQLRQVAIPNTVIDSVGIDPTDARAG